MKKTRQEYILRDAEFLRSARSLVNVSAASRLAGISSERGRQIVARFLRMCWVNKKYECFSADANIIEAMEGMSDESFEEAIALKASLDQARKT